MHCMDCGTKLEQTNYTQKVSAYHCSKCEVFWYRSVKHYVTWDKSKKK